MSASEIESDLTSCTDGNDPGIEHRGTYQAGVAVHVPVVAVPADAGSTESRIMFAKDDAGTFTCIDGSGDQWAAGGVGEGRTPSNAHPAASLDGISGEQSCNTTSRDGRLEHAMLWQVTDRVVRARFTVRSDGQPPQVVDLRPAGGVVAVWLWVSGPSAWADTTWSMQFLDADGDPVTIDTARNAGTPAPAAETRPLDSCVRITKIRNLGHEPDPRPKSDAAGVAACRKEVKTYAEDQQPSFDAATAGVELTISADRTWGTILRDGDRYVACSRFPTQEISEIRSSGRAVSKKSFSWALNPIGDTGESFWAAGQLDGVESISYLLPDGQRVPARISAGGYWMVMARNPTAFDTEENVDNWSPVVVIATIGGVEHSYRIGWSEQTMCNQVSHGC